MRSKRCFQIGHQVLSNSRSRTAAYCSRRRNTSNRLGHRTSRKAGRFGLPVRLSVHGVGLHVNPISVMVTGVTQAIAVGICGTNPTANAKGVCIQAGAIVTRCRVVNIVVQPGSAHPRVPVHHPRIRPTSCTTHRRRWRWVKVQAKLSVHPTTLVPPFTRGGGTIFRRRTKRSRRGYQPRYPCSLRLAAPAVPHSSVIPSQSHFRHKCRRHRCHSSKRHCNRTQDQTNQVRIRTHQEEVGLLVNRDEVVTRGSCHNLRDIRPQW